MGHSGTLAQPRDSVPAVIQNVWAWVKNYDGARGGYPSPSTILLTGVIAAVLGVVALARDSIGLGIFAIVLGAVQIIWAEVWHRAPGDDD
jgi:hypothetical protein